MVQPVPADAPGAQVQGGAGCWSRVLRRRWGIIGFAVACGLVAALAAFSIKPVYEAEATLLLDSRRQGLSPVQEQGDWGRPGCLDSRTFMQTQALLIKSRSMAEAVVDRLKLWETPEFDPRQARAQIDWTAWLGSVLPVTEPRPAPTEAEARAQTINAVVGQVQAAPVPDSVVMRLGFRAQDPQQAARIANVYIDVYMELGAGRGLQAVSEAVTWLTGRLDGLRKEVEASELKLQAFREAEGLVGTPGTLDLVDKQVSDLAGRVFEARARRDDLQGLYDQIHRAEKLSRAELVAHPTLARNSTVQALKASELKAESDVSELAKRYGPQHPKMVAALADLDALRGKMNVEIGNAVSGVQKELEVARAQTDKLEAELGATRINAQDAGRKELALSALQREVESHRQLYDLFLTRFREAKLLTDLPSTSARIIDPAMVPVVSVEPQIRPILAGVTLLALIVGVVVAFMIDCFDVRSVWPSHRQQWPAEP